MRLACACTGEMRPLRYLPGYRALLRRHEVFSADAAGQQVVGVLPDLRQRDVACRGKVKWSSSAPWNFWTVSAYPGRIR